MPEQYLWFLLIFLLGCFLWILKSIYREFMNIFEKVVYLEQKTQLLDDMIGLLYTNRERPNNRPNEKKEGTN